MFSSTYKAIPRDSYWTIKKQYLLFIITLGCISTLLVEYVIVVALVAVAAIAVYQLFGQVIRSQTAAMAREIAGEDGSEQSRAAQSAAESAAAQTAAKSLKSFTGNAAAGQ